MSTFKEKVLAEIKRRVFNDYTNGESELDEAAQGALSSLYYWIEGIKEEDWEAYRREVAKEVLAGIATNIQIYLNEKDKCRAAVHDALALTDELIGQ